MRKMMSTLSQIRKPRYGRKGWLFLIISLSLVAGAGCGPRSTQPSDQIPPSATSLQATSTLAAPTATSEDEAQIPAGWVTHSSQSCEYMISYPSEMQVTSNGPHSQIFEFNPANPDEPARNFAYVSVVDPEINDMVNEGIYLNDVYNYDPGETEILLSMQVGESQTVREIPNVESGFTYQRTPDSLISGYSAQTYENDQPWEFPGGTKEIRYLLSINGCTYLIGGYLDTTASNQPGAITEELFKEIVATIQVIP